MNADGQQPDQPHQQRGDRLRIRASSPDGTKIAFTSARDGNQEIYAMNADGAEPDQPHQHRGVRRASRACSPDGTKIAFTSERNGNREIYVMDADGQNQTNLTINAVLDFGPAFSPTAPRSPSAAPVTAIRRST